jgi:hypothetical protein
MICSLLLDCDDGVDFPGNIGMALGRPFSAYPLIAARSSGLVARHFVVTASPPVKSVAAQNDASIIDPPAGDHEHCPGRSLLAHGFAKIKEELKSEKEPLELLLVFFAHAPAVTGDLIAEGVEALRAKPELDGAVSVSPRNRLNPFFARRETADGLLEPFVPYAADKQGEVWYPNWGLQVLRPARVEAPAGEGPFPWLGRKVLPLKQWGGGPVDFKWQVPSIEYWLKKHGYSDLTPSMELQPKPQLKPQTERR